MLQAHRDLQLCLWALQKCLPVSIIIRSIIIIIIIIPYSTLCSFHKPFRCQECPEAHVIPDVNNCGCSCLLCAECPRNDTIKTRCSITTDTVCYRTEDQTPRPHAACPWIKTSSAPTTQVLTTHGPTTHGPTTDNEKVAVNTSRSICYSLKFSVCEWSLTKNQSLHRDPIRTKLTSVNSRKKKKIFASRSKLP